MSTRKLKIALAADVLVLGAFEHGIKQFTLVDRVALAVRQREAVCSPPLAFVRLGREDVLAAILVEMDIRMSGGVSEHGEGGTRESDGHDANDGIGGRVREPRLDEVSSAGGHLGG